MSHQWSDNVARSTNTPTPHTPTPWELNRLEPHASDGPNSLPRWSINHSHYPDTTGMIGAGIITFSSESVAYVSAEEANAAYIVMCVNQHEQLIKENQELKEAWEEINRRYTNQLDETFDLRNALKSLLNTPALNGQELDEIEVQAISIAQKALTQASGEGKP